MACKITIELVSELQEGTIGNDWKYELEVKIFAGARIGKGTIKVPLHTLDSGDQRPPPGPPEPLVLPAGDPGGEIDVELRLSVTEVDLIHDDKGSIVTNVKIVNPASGGAPVVVDRDIPVGVTEEPSGIGSATFTLGLRLTVGNE